MLLKRRFLFLALAVLPLASARADFADFGTNGTGFTLNQGQSTGGLSVAGNVATLTNGGSAEGNSLFYNTKQTISAFKVSFTYRDVGATGTATGTADGFTFTLQNDTRGATAVGGTGNSLGYAAAGGTTIRTAVTPSAAVAFNVYNASTTGLGTNGALTLTNTTSNAVLYSGNPINVTLNYSGTTLTETLLDTTTNKSDSFTYSVNLITALGTTAYVGFTGATGGTVSTQTISNFSYTVVPEPSTWAGGGLMVLASVAMMGRRARRPRPVLPVPGL